MGIIVISAVLAVSACAAALVAFTGKKAGLKGTTRVVSGVTAGFAVVLILVIWVFSAITVVGPSDVGIVTAFGHTVGSDLGPGMHFVAPWESVTIWDDSVQRLPFEGSKCLEIRIANQQSACLDVIVFWKDRRAASDGQFKQFRTFPRVQAAYFSRGVITKFYNNVFENYDPVALASAAPVKAAPAGQSGFTGGVTVSSLTVKVLQNMQAAYRNVADVTSLNSGQVRYNTQVEQALSRVITAKANTNVALQNKQASVYQAAAAANLNRNNSLTPAVVEQNCLNITQAILQAGGHLSPAWNCVSGGGGGVIVSGR